MYTDSLPFAEGRREQILLKLKVKERHPIIATGCQVKRSEANEENRPYSAHTLYVRMNSVLLRSCDRVSNTFNGHSTNNESIRFETLADYNLHPEYAVNFHLIQCFRLRKSI